MSANATCVAYDSLGIKIPEKIVFVRREKFGGYHELTADNKFYFTKRTEGRHGHDIGLLRYLWKLSLVSLSFPVVLDLVNNTN